MADKKVYLVQENPYISVLSAEEYGEIVTLFESGSQIMFSPQPDIRKLKRKLKDFNDNEKFDKSKPITKWERQNTLDC